LYKHRLIHIHIYAQWIILLSVLLKLRFVG